jgi:RNA recognition motif-containing protein
MVGVFVGSTALAALNGREVLGSQLGVAWHVVQGAKEDTSQHITVFCGNIGDQIDEYTLFEAFAQYNCSDSRIVRGEDGRCLGYGFVTIRTQDDATAACTAMDGQRLMGRPLRVSLARTARHSETKEGVGSSNRPPDPPASTDVVTVARQASESNVTVHVGNLLGTETEENMRNAFKEYGQIDNIRVPGKNFGFVAYTTHLAAAAAIANRNGTTPPGFTRPIRCTWASERRNPTPSATTATPAPAVGPPGIPPPAMPGAPTAPPPPNMPGPGGAPGHYGPPPPGARGRQRTASLS